MTLDDLSISEAEVQIFYEGEHVVTSGNVRAYDSASVRAFDSASVEAYDSASVTASDSASVTVAAFYASGVKTAAEDFAIIIDRRTTPPTIYGKCQIERQAVR